MVNFLLWQSPDGNACSINGAMAPVLPSFNSGLRQRYRLGAFLSLMDVFWPKPMGWLQWITFYLEGGTAFEMKPALVS